MQVETFPGGIPMSRSRDQQEEDDMPHLGGTPTWLKDAFVKRWFVFDSKYIYLHYTLHNILWSPYFACIHKFWIYIYLRGYLRMHHRYRVERQIGHKAQLALLWYFWVRPSMIGKEAIEVMPKSNQIWWLTWLLTLHLSLLLNTENSKGRATKNHPFLHMLLFSEGSWWAQNTRTLI